MAGIEDLLNQEAGYTYGDILPIRSRTDGSGNPEFAVPGLISGTINSAINAFTLPGDVAAGRREVTPADNVNFALNVSGLGALGRVAPRASLAVEERVLGQRLKNAVVPEPNPAAPQDKFSRMINGRPLTSPEQVTHGRRNISRAELEETR
jgi:hypothetical protein